MIMDTQTPSVADLDDALHEYILTTHCKEDDLQRQVLTMAQEADLPAIQVSPPLGRLLSMLVHISGARSILEIGTLGGYSAIWMGRALPVGGRLLSLEISPEHAEVARRAVQEAGLAGTVEIRVGPALDTLRTLSPVQRFDMVFIDANKDQYPEYLEWALRLVRPGGMIIADNVLRNGAVLQDPAPDADALAIQRFNELVSKNPRLESTIILTRSGRSSRDGLSVSWVRDESLNVVTQFTRE
jgi:predicted O-methyltransferase YrrM